MFACVSRNVDRLPSSSQKLTLCSFESLNHLLFLDRWKIVQKFLNVVSPFKVIDQILDRDTSSSEHRYNSENFRIRSNYFCLHLYNYGINRAENQEMS